VYPIKKQKKLYSQRATSSEKGDPACHVSENAPSAGLVGILKKNILQGRNLTKKFHRGENHK